MYKNKEVKKGYEWSEDVGFRKTPQNLKELADPYNRKRFSADERIARAEGFNRAKEKEDYFSNLIKEPELGSTAPTGKTVDQLAAEVKPFSIPNWGQSAPTGKTVNQLAVEGKSFFSPKQSEPTGNTTTLISGGGGMSQPSQVKSVNKNWDLFYDSPSKSTVPTAATAPSSISDSYQKMGFGRIGSLGGVMGGLEKASLRLGQAQADRRIKEQELENESQLRLAKEGFGYQSSLQKQKSELERKMQELENESQSRLSREGFGYQSSLQKQKSELERQMEEWRNKQERKKQMGI